MTTVAGPQGEALARRALRQAAVPAVGSASSFPVCRSARWSPSRPSR